MRAFVRLREIFSTHKDLAQQLAELKRKAEKQGIQINAIFEAIRTLMAPEQRTTQRIGFLVT